MKKVNYFIALLLLLWFGLAVYNHAQVERKTTVRTPADVMEVVRDSSYQSIYTGSEIDSAVGHFIGDEYTRYVGGGEKNYPLTINGIKAAILTIDSGVVYINYPGISDTTGIGAIPTTVVLRGWILGRYYLSNNNYVDGYGIKTNVSKSALSAYGANLNTMQTNVFNKQTSDNPSHGWDDANVWISTFLENKLPVNEWTRGIKMITEVKQTSGTAVLNNTACGINIFTQLNYSTVDQPTASIVGIDNFSANRGTKNIGSVYSYRCELKISGAGNVSDGYSFYSTGVVGSSSGKVTNYYGFYSNSVVTGLAAGGKFYHFYGIGNYPSWFGGNVNGLGFNYFSDTQASDAYVVTLEGAHTLTAGLEVTFKANTANTGAATLQVNSLAVKNLTKAASGSVATALATGDILAGQIVKAVYDGTQFQIISRLAQ